MALRQTTDREGTRTPRKEPCCILAPDGDVGAK